MKEPINDGGPAFPSASVETVFIEELGRYDDRLGPPMGGMSLRDYFAAKAMALGGEFFHNIDDHSDPPNDAEHVASISYAIADAMLAERAK